MKLLKILFVIAPGNPIKTLALFMLFMLLMLPSILSGQNVTWKNYTYSELSAGALLLDGDTLWLGSDKGLAKLNTVTLSNENITPDSLRYNAECIGMDKQKNIWMGTRGAGLFKYDGKSWTVYKQNNSGLPDDLVSAISADKQGNVWIATGRGLAKFDGKDWKTFKLLSADTLNNGIEALCIDSSNNVWAAVFGKLYKFDGTDWKVFDGANWGWPSDNVSSMKADSTGKVWIATMYGLYTFDGTTWGKIQVPYMGENLSLTLDKQGNVLLLGTNASYIYSSKTSTGKSIIYSGYYAVPDPKGYIWWTTRGTLTRFKDDFSTDLEINLSVTFPGQNVTDITFDQKGNAWIGTNEGLASFDGKSWTSYEYLSPNSTHPAAISAITAGSQGELWVGTKEDGLYLYDGATFKNFNKSNSGMKSNWVRAVAVDLQGNVWIGTYGGGLLKYDGVNWVQYCPYNDIYSITVDSKGAVWVGTDGGLTKFEGNNSTNYNVSNSGLPGNFIYSLAVDQKDNIWFLSYSHREYYNGYLMKFDGQNFSKPEIPGLRAQEYMSSVAVDEKGVIWAGHGYEGIFKYDGSNWTQLNSSNSVIRAGVIYKITIDKYGNKWINYGNGVFVYNENGIVSEVKGETVSAPKEFSLTQNYPNPFNPTTNISYSIHEAQNVKLTVYDMLGKEVSILVNEYKSAGTYRVNFNASHLPSGVYIYTIQAGEFRESKKLVLLK
ncbi:MAG: two-component regulator propeller domain-containing protein [Syntrophomonadaceae bacterium]